MTGHLLHDIRYAVRMLKRSPGLTITAVLTLAIGIGANTAIFTVVNAVLLRSLPYEASDRLTLIYGTVRRPTGVERRSVSFPEFVDWERLSRSFEAVAATSSESFTMAIAGAPERMSGELVSGKYFETLKARAALGRTLGEDDDAGANGDTIVISDAAWKTRFGARRSVVGETVRVDDRPVTIVGVMPPEFLGVTDTSDVWAPIRRFTSPDVQQNRGNRWHAVVARLRAGVTMEQAQQEMDAVAAQLARDYPESNGDRGVEIADLRTEIVGDLREPLWVLLGAVACVLLITCANIANLLLARASVRQKEMAVRVALGARRSRLVAQLLTESVMLAILGGGVGVLVAFWGVDALLAVSPVTLPRFATVNVDVTVLLASAATSLLTGLAFGLVPALSLSARGLSQSVRQSGHTALTDPRGDRTRRILVVAEIALSLVLIIGAALLLRTLRELTTMNPGFRPAGLLTFRLDLPVTRYDSTRALSFAQSVTDALATLPGVTRVAVASDVPLGGVVQASFVTLDRRSDGDTSRVRTYVHRVGPGYFAALGTPMLEGREFTGADTDHGQAEGVAIVSERLARRYWSDGAINKRLMIGETRFAVVGVAAHVRQRSLTESGAADPDVYLPFAQNPSTGFALVVRANPEQTGIVTGIRTAIRNLDSSVPMFVVAWGDELVNQQTASSQFTAGLLAVFAVTALALSLIGIYGVLSFLVSREARHIGIRMALGAGAGDIMRLVVRRAVWPIAAGVGIGIASAFGVTRVLRTLLFGVSSTDPATFVFAPLMLAVVALLACYGPARRAARVDPIVALRTE